MFRAGKYINLFSNVFNISCLPTHGDVAVKVNLDGDLLPSSFSELKSLADF